MGCNCTANLRADIIKRFFANQFNGKEFALELIRIVECQQTVMSRELENWFKVWFRFPQDMLEEFLACVMKRQTTMSSELQKVIRARFFPTDQRMADDFIRVVLCGCCPEMCEAPLGGIIGISKSFTADGWYLQADASNLVYMESNVITQTIPCSSGLADYGHEGGDTFSGYEYPHIFYSGSWSQLTEVNISISEATTYLVQFYVDINYVFGTNFTANFQYSTDSGATWITAISTTEVTTNQNFDFGTNDFFYRLVIIDNATGCQFYNPSPEGGQRYGIYYATIDPSVDPIFTLLGSINGVTPLDDPFNDWVDILITMAEPYQTVAGRLGGIGVDFSQQDGGGGFESPFYLQIISPIGSVPTELAVVLKSDASPFDTSPQGVATVVKNYVATYTFADPDVTFFEGFVIFGANVRYNQLGITNPAIQQEVELFMIEYQLADPAFSFYVVVNPTNVEIFVTTAIPVTDVLMDETGVGSTVVPLIEI